MDRLETSETRDLTLRMEEELRKSREKILEQQESVIAEERLKVLLQLTGATAHELNQPLMVLLNSVDLMKRHREDPAKSSRYLDRIERAGEQMAEIVGRVQNVRHYDTKPYLGSTSIINLDQKINLLVIESRDEKYDALSETLKQCGGIL